MTTWDTIQGPPLKQVRQVHPHLLKLSNGCAAPVLMTLGRPLEVENMKNDAIS